MIPATDFKVYEAEVPCILASKNSRDMRKRPVLYMIRKLSAYINANIFRRIAPMVLNAVFTQGAKVGNNEELKRSSIIIANLRLDASLCRLKSRP